MNFLQEIFGKVQIVEQNAKPDPRQLMDSALGSTMLDNTVPQYIESPQDGTQ